MTYTAPGQGLASMVLAVREQVGVARTAARQFLTAHGETLRDALDCAAIMAAGTFVIYMAAVLQGGGA